MLSLQDQGTRLAVGLGVLLGLGNLLTFSYANFVAASPPAPAAPPAGRVEPACHEPFSEHLRDRRCVDTYLPSACVEPLPFALHLLRSNLEFRAATRQAQQAALVVAISSAKYPTLNVGGSEASKLSVGLEAPTNPTSMSTRPEPLIVERVRLSYRVQPPSVRGAMFDVSG